MLNVISDPNLYLLFFAAYVVGFIDLDDPTGQHAGWGRVSDIAFWCGLGIAVTLFATHGFAGGAAGMLAAWAISLVGLRRGVLAQRNSLWETALWTMPLAMILATGVPATTAAAAASNKPERARQPRDRRRRAVHVREPQWRLPALASLLPGHGRRMTLLGIAMDVATCFVLVSALSLLAH